MATKKTKKDSKFDFRTIRTFEDACKKERINPEQLPELSSIPEGFRKPLLALYKLLIIYKAINNGWIPDWNDHDQYKYYPWFEVLSSGFGFSFSYYLCDNSTTDVGSRLCTDTSEKAMYIAEQFEVEYKDYFLN
jgi:hypothetical protein